MDHIVNEAKAKVLVCFKIFTAYFFKKKPKALYAPTHALYTVAQGWPRSWWRCSPP